ncbi:MAG TPA: hypothetical protein VIK18_18465, partial [Pirellulales bacterium]
MSVRSRSRAWVLAAVWLGSAGLAAGAEQDKPDSKAKAQSQSESRPNSKIEIVKIEPEPLRLSPGEPMSRMALVTEPAKLTGAVSWTVETHQHRGRLISLALSPDATLAATAGVDGSIHLWELATGKLVRVIVGHNSHIMSVAWSPDGNTIASGGRG